jgi:TPR repeat protein
LGFLHRGGYGFTRNDAEAAKRYRLAADQGFAEAQFNLGVMYLQGEGIQQDIKEAARLFELAAMQGEAHAQHAVGILFAEGQDYIHAHVWLSLAAEQGNSGAATSRDDIAAKLSPEQVREAEELARRCKASSYQQCE